MTTETPPQKSPSTPPAPSTPVEPTLKPTPGFSAPDAWRIDGISPTLQNRAAQAAAESNQPLADWLTKAVDDAISFRPGSKWPAGLTGFAIGAAASAAVALGIMTLATPPVPRPADIARAPTSVVAPTPVAAPAPVQAASPPQPPAAPPAATPVPPTPAATPPAVTPAPSFSVASPPPLPPLDPNDPQAELKRAAQGGDAAAQFTLAARYAAGDGVAQDWAEAFKWFSLAAAAGMPTAQHNLAVMYERSRGTDQNLDEAAKWYAKAAEQGYPPSQYNLAVAYARGWGLPVDTLKAVEWFERAAERIPQANIALAEIFEGGLGVPRDLARARSYYQLAETAGDQRAAQKLRQLTPEVVQREITKEVQILLGKLRFNTGGTDGRAGPRTVAAIKEFQRTAGVPGDGKATQALLELLRSVAPSG